MAAKNPELVEKFLQCLIEGSAIFKTNKPKTLAAVKKYMKGADDDILEESYQHTRATIDEAPYPSLAVVEQGLEMLSLQYPQATQTDPALIIDPSFMKKIDDSGCGRFIKNSVGRSDPFKPGPVHSWVCSRGDLFVGATSRGRP